MAAATFVLGSLGRGSDRDHRHGERGRRNLGHAERHGQPGRRCDRLVVRVRHLDVVRIQDFDDRSRLGLGERLRLEER